MVALSKTEVQETRASIEALIRPLLATGSGKGHPGGFQLDACEKHKINWPSVILQRETPTLTYTFREGCDVQGTINPRPFQPFPIDLKLKNLERFDRIQATSTVTAELEANPILRLQLREGAISGKSSRALFEADYGVRVSPGEGRTVSENLGGELRISEINGKKVTINEKIRVK
jgi:hypothetical protein